MDPRLTVKDLKNRTDENEMDLSLMGISKIPVKEIASVTKANSVDLSCNRITMLPDGFCSMLSYLVKLDLSKNGIEHLPTNFGNMKQLQHLDLYQNKLKLIPVSFSQLKNLKWLDLKDNNLDPSYIKVVGDCLDDKQCRSCAANVVKEMRLVASDQERKKQQQLKIKREQEAAKKMEEEQLAQQRKEAKKLEREEKRRKWEEDQKLRNLVEKKEVLDNSANASIENEVFETSVETKSSKSCFGTCIGALLVAAIAIMIGIHFYCRNYPYDMNCALVNAKVDKIRMFLQIWSRSMMDMVKLSSGIVREKVNELFH